MQLVKPLVTIVTPSFNQGQFIEETILSVLNQTYINIQYIIIDGGSTDTTMEVIEKYRKRIDIIIQEKDQGQTDAINKGFRQAKGELVGWLNSDDILYADCVEKIVDLYIQKPDGSVYYSSQLNWINKKNEIIAVITVKIKSREYLLNRNYSIIQQGSFYPKKLVEVIHFLDISYHYCMDLDLWLKLLNYGKIYYISINRPVSAFRIYNGTKTDTGKIKFLKNIKDVLLKNGAKWYSINIFLIYYYSLKSLMKSTLCRH